MGVGADKILGVQRVFPNFPKLARTVFLCNFCLQMFSQKDHYDLVLV